MDGFEPLVSIIIPVYNGSEYLHKAIESALEQTYRNCEVIVVNDGSQDNGATEEICRSFGDRIRYFSQDHAGMAAAVNHGIREMLGEYFTCMFHNVIYYPDRIERQVDALARQEDKTVFVHSNYDILYEKKKQFVHHNLHYLHTEERLTNGNFAVVFLAIHLCSVLIHKDHIERVGLFDETLSENQGSYWLFHAMRGQPSIFLQEQLFIIRHHNGQGDKSRRKNTAGFNQMMIDFCESLSDEEKTKFCGSPQEFYGALYLFLVDNVPQANNCLTYLSEKLSEYKDDMGGLMAKTWQQRRRANWINRQIARGKYQLAWLFGKPYQRVKGVFPRIKQMANAFVDVVIGFFVCLPYTLDLKSDYFASVFSMGDTLIMGGLFPAYRKCHPEKKCKVIVRQSHKQIVGFYEGEFDELIYVSSFQARVIRAYFIVASRFSSRMHFCLPDRTLFIPDADAGVRNVSLGLLQSYRRVFSLPVSAEFVKPRYPRLSAPERDKLVKRYGIVPGKTVILAPYSITLGVFDYTEPFEKMAKSLKKKGYHVLTNTTDSRCIEGTSPFNAGIYDVVALAENTDLWVISVRSGLCDLLSLSKCRLSVIYPAKHFHKFFSLTGMFGKRDGLTEHIMAPEEKNIQKILGWEDEDESADDQ